MEVDRRDSPHRRHLHENWSKCRRCFECTCVVSGLMSHKHLKESLIEMDLPFPYGEQDRERAQGSLSRKPRLNMNSDHNNVRWSLRSGGNED